MGAQAAAVGATGDGDELVISVDDANGEQPGALEAAGEDPVPDPLGVVDEPDALQIGEPRQDRGLLGFVESFTARSLPGPADFGDVGADPLVQQHRVEPPLCLSQGAERRRVDLDTGGVRARLPGRLLA